MDFTPTTNAQNISYSFGVNEFAALTICELMSWSTGYKLNHVWSGLKHFRIHEYVTDTTSKTFDHDGTTYYHASRKCSQTCLDDDVYISYDCVVGSQAHADFYRFNLFRPPNVHVDVCH